MTTLCLFCGGDASASDHALRCDGRQGTVDAAIDLARGPTLDDDDARSWVPPIPPTSEALDGLSPDALAAILDTVTPEQIDALVSALSRVPQHADLVRRALSVYPWFPTHATRDTQLRRIRTLRDAAVAHGHPVCSTNAGYALGDWTEVCASAVRARRFAQGAYARAELLERLAAQMSKRRGSP